MIPAKECVWRSFAGRRGNLLLNIGLNRFLNPCVNVIECRGIKNKNKKEDAPSCIASVARRLPVTSNSDYIDVGAELSSSLTRVEITKILNSFAQRKEIKSLALEQGLDESLWKQAFNSFRMYCISTKTLPVDLHIVLSDVVQGAGNVTDIFPYFTRHAKNLFPHISCLDDLKKISDLRSPANWYPLARSATRRIIFHAGPTNSGKTHHALERFYNAKSGVYCGPLKLLVSEVFQKSNSRGTPCDLVTGDERKYAYGPDKPASHLSCSVEMINVKNNYEVAIIDEIQQMRDSTRGWAWTRALLGIPAEEIHVCGEAAAINLVTAICWTTGENVEVRKYKRLTELEVERSPLGSFHRVQPGDCIVCFNKHDIYSVSRSIERTGKKVAVIYGSLPPATKLAQAAKFNDPNDPCKIMVATNAIGMGLNLHIRRIVFYSLIQPTINDRGEKEMDIISVSSALQIAGRAGRYGTSWEKGYVTTYKVEDLPTLKCLLNKTPEEIVQAGLHPTADQIELYAYYLPKTSLSSLMDLFVSLCKVDNSLYFMCNIDDFKFLADMIEHISLPLRARYVFCCAPINRKFPFVCSMFLKFAREYSKNSPVTLSWLCENIGWPFRTPETVIDLIHLESVFDVFDLYLWLSYRFMDLFPHGNMVRDLQNELDAIIEKAVYGVVKLLEKSETGLSSGYSSISDADNFVLQTSKQNFYKGDNCISKQRRQGKLTEKLLNQGLLTPQMLEELHQEWSAGKKK